MRSTILSGQLSLVILVGTASGAGDEAGTHLYECRQTLAEDLAEMLTELIRATGPGGLSDPISVTADPATNRVRCRTRDRRYADLRGLIERLDVRRPTVVFVVALAAVPAGVDLDGIAGAPAPVATEPPRTLWGVPLADPDDPTRTPDGPVYGLVDESRLPAVLESLRAVERVRIVRVPAVPVDDGREGEVAFDLPTLPGRRATLHVSPHISSSRYLKIGLRVDLPGPTSGSIEEHLVLPGGSTVVVRDLGPGGGGERLLLFLTPVVLRDREADGEPIRPEETWARSLREGRSMREDLALLGLPDDLHAIEASGITDFASFSRSDR